MKLSEQWLREWVNSSIDIHAMKEQLTMVGLEVESVTPVAGIFDKVIVGLVTHVAPHPNAIRLSICKVAISDAELLTIVCGASNVCPNLKVAVALVGATLPDGMTIKKAKLRGVVSEGMLCSATELCLSDESDGILELPATAPLGQDLRQYMLLDDYSMELVLTPNRGDCLSVVGVAREVAVLNRCQLKPITIMPPNVVLNETKAITLAQLAGCGRYCGRIIRDINIDATTPLWMAEKLRRSGLRSISLVVDITNYVMLELGQPLHAFDLSKITGNIEVRCAHKAEQLIILDGQHITLNETTTVIADNNGAIAMAGIVGGKNTAVTATTSAIFLESAFFAQQSIAGQARSYGLSTDASHRFERGVDPELQQTALERATQLIIQLTGGEAGPITVATDAQYLPAAKFITLRPARVTRILGITLNEECMHDCLERLGMTVFVQGDTWEVKIPSNRFDIIIEADLIEEVARIYGYNNIPLLPLEAPLQALPRSESCISEGCLSKTLVDRGYHEIISYSFVDPQLQELLYPDGACVDVLNPISQELSQMRKGLWPGLLAAVLYNQCRQTNSMRLFERGVRFSIQNGELLQQAVIAGVCAGSLDETSWNSVTTREFDFYDIKGDVMALLQLGNAGDAYTFTTAVHPCLHPGQTACIHYKNKPIGWLGTLHPDMVHQLDLAAPILLFEVEQEALRQAVLPQFTAISKYPSIRRDLSFIINKSVTAAEICTLIQQNTHEILQNVRVFDVYYSAEIAADQKSMAIALTLQHQTHTLIDSEITRFIDAIISKLKQFFNIILRE